MFIQFSGSTMTVSFTLYQLTKISSTSIEYAKMSLYMYCMLIQIYLYCWYGNLVTLKVWRDVKYNRRDWVLIIEIILNTFKIQSKEIIDRIFDINWTVLDNSVKTSLLIMMNRAMNPISLVVAKIFSLNLDSFISVGIPITIYQSIVILNII